MTDGPHPAVLVTNAPPENLTHRPVLVPEAGGGWRWRCPDCGLEAFGFRTEDAAREYAEHHTRKAAGQAVGTAYDEIVLGAALPVEPVWYVDHGNLAAVARFMADNPAYEKEDMAYMVEKPWKYDEVYADMLDAREGAEVRSWLETQTVAGLRDLAVGMPYRSESNKAAIVDWLVWYRRDAAREAMQGGRDR